MKQYDIYTTRFILNHPKGLCEPWKNDFAHVQYITSGGMEVGWDGKKSGQDCGGHSVNRAVILNNHLRKEVKDVIKLKPRRNKQKRFKVRLYYTC